MPLHPFLASARMRGMTVAGVALATATTAQAVTYTSVNVGALIGNGETSSVGTSVNSAGQIGGYYNNAGAGSLPFVYTPGPNGTPGTATTIPGVGQGYTSMVGGINNAGLAVGLDASTENGFTYNINTKVFTTVSKGSNYSVVLNGVNSSGVASGYIQSAPYYNHSGASINTVTGTSTDVSVGFSGPATNASATPVFSINDSGQLAGTGVNKSTTSGVAVPYIATPNGSGGFTYLDLSTSVKTADPSFSAAGGAQYIDALGNVAGTYNVSTSSGTAYLYNAASGLTTTIPVPSGYIAINVEGIADVNGVPEVVGSRKLPSRTYTAFTYMNGVATDISGVVPGYVLTDANGVNSNGDLVATGTPIGGGAAQVFLLTVVPEPTSLMALVASPMLLARRRRLA